ncbi:hypothetical protein BC827DRAFT_1158709 [Russula dissimulans]|nr:hypothetical protein BC827DRAFT_1158709 [Russula dissimulans]
MARLCAESTAFRSQLRAEKCRNIAGGRHRDNWIRRAGIPRLPGRRGGSGHSGNIRHLEGEGGCRGKCCRRILGCGQGFCNVEKTLPVLIFTGSVLESDGSGVMGILLRVERWRGTPLALVLPWVAFTIAKGTLVAVLQPFLSVKLGRLPLLFHREQVITCEYHESNFKNVLKFECLTSWLLRVFGNEAQCHCGYNGPDSPMMNTRRGAKVTMRKQSMHPYVFREWSDKLNQGRRSTPDFDL